MDDAINLWPSSDNVWLIFAAYSAASLATYIGVSHIVHWFVNASEHIWIGSKEKIEKRIEVGKHISNVLVMVLIFGVGFYLFMNERKALVAATSERDRLASELATAKQRANDLTDKTKQLEAWQGIRQALLPLAGQFPFIRIRIVDKDETVQFARQLAAVLRSIGINVPGDYPYYNTGAGRGIFVIVRDIDKPPPKARLLLQALRTVFDRVNFLGVANADDAAPELYVGYPPQ